MNNLGEYNPDEGCDPPTCPVCDKQECVCPPEENVWQEPGVSPWGNTPTPNDSEHEACRSEIEGNWEQIEAQLSYWQDMDNQYWIQRKEKEYRAYLDRKVRGFLKQIDSDLKEAKKCGH